ncbi:hypothetical protein ACHHYP_08722 [Achlya hypogyna]|uniref:PA14 domain-containing protein n=1 Tax=Achlya hypogyna TaxID=1202772 RepID=A0A1V9ZK47_ACHHY|nr:hypothetical protein ACHHYP_08722 [Achlya hypogyna]
MRAGVLLGAWAAGVNSFRLLNATDVSALVSLPPAVFGPYARGNVGYYGDPTTTAFREHINPGVIFNPEQPTQWTGVTISLQCPGMVGPFSDGEYYCVGKAYGFCDRRSSTCWCNKGYTGVACTECIPEYYPLGGLCYPRKNCPNDCSGQGSCNYASGTCTCNPSRVGADCSLQSCAAIDALCTSCAGGSCRSCIPGYFVNASNRCAPCTLIDPRCIKCDIGVCLVCADFQLNSVKRSGPRSTDLWPLPPEEVGREFSFQAVYGTQSPHVFDETEAYFVVPTPLGATTACTQGTRGDATWTCVAAPSSHAVCGHAGTITFLSPTYAVAENATWLPVTVVRTGGGAGSASVDYELVHVTTTSADVSPTAYYTTSQRLIFLPGVVRLTFQVTIHDNAVVGASNAVFELRLRAPSEGATVGDQRTAAVVILDDDRPVAPIATVSKTSVAGVSVPITVAGVPTPMVVTAVYRRGPVVDTDQSPPLELLLNSSTQLLTTVRWAPTVAGSYSLRFHRLICGGLLGTYFSSAWLQGPVLAARVDAVINATATDAAWAYGSARWRGFVRAAASEATTFRIDARGGARLWVNGRLVIDGWLALDVPNRAGTVLLQANALYELQLDVRPAATGLDRVALLWQSASVALQVVPAAALYFAVPHLGLTTTVVVQPGIPAQALFRGPTTGVAGVPFVVHFYAVDAYGNARSQVFFNATDDYRVVLVGGVGTVDAAVVADPTTGVFSATLNPRVAGAYNLSIVLNQVAVRSFVVTITPSPNAGPRSVVGGPGVAPVGVMAAASATVVLRGIDVFGNSQALGGAAFRLRATHVASGRVDLGAITDLNNGSYVATYVPRFSGAYAVAVTVAGLHVDQSPYAITVAHNIAHGPACSITAGTGATVATTGVPAAFVVQLRDVNGNTVVSGAAAVVLASSSALGSPSCLNLLNGTYLCSYTPTNATTAMPIAVTVNGLPIAQSPFAVAVTTGAAAANVSRALSPPGSTGLYYGVAGRPAWFLIQANDIYGNHRSGADPVVVSFLNASGGAVIANATAVAGLGGGLYNVSYVLTAAGAYALHIALNVAGNAVTGSPFAVTVYPNIADATTTTATVLTPLPFIAGVPIVAVLEPRDAYGNPTTNQGYTFTAALTSPAASVVATLVPANTTATVVTVVPTVAAVYSFRPEVFLGGGGNATLFRNAQGLGPGVPLLQQPLAFDFGAGAASPDDMLAAFSVLWDGYLRAPATELFTLTVTVAGTLTLWLDGTVALNTSQASTYTVAVRLEAGRQTPCRVFFAKTAQMAAFNVRWASPSTPEGPVPTSALFARWRVTSVTPTLRVYPEASAPPRFALLAPVPQVWIAGAPVVFRVDAFDRFGNARGVGGDGVGVAIDGSAATVNIVDLRNGSYVVTATATTATPTATLVVGVNATPVDSALSPGMFARSLWSVGGVPVAITVAPAPPVLINTRWTGPGLVSGVAGSELHFALTLCDAFGNVVAASQAVAVALEPAVACAVSGTYDVVCPVTIAASYALTLTVGGHSISPPAITPVVVPSGAATARVGVATPQHPAQETRALAIALFDAYGNALVAGGDVLRVVFTGAATTPATVVDLANGSYVAYYQLPLPGVYEVDVVRVHDPGLLGRYYGGTARATPDVTSVDTALAVAGYSKVVWTGFLLGGYSETFTLTAPAPPGGSVRLFVDGRLVDGPVVLREGFPHALAVHVETPVAWTLALAWASARTPASPVPLTALYARATPTAPPTRVVAT